MVELAKKTIAPSEVAGNEDVIVLELGEEALVVVVGRLEDQQKGEGHHALDYQHEEISPPGLGLELVHRGRSDLLCCHQVGPSVTHPSQTVLELHLHANQQQIPCG